MRSILLAAVAVIGLGITAAHATFTVNITQDGNNVVATGSGTLDLSGLELVNHLPFSSQINPKLNEISFDSSSSFADIYITTQESGGLMGSGGSNVATSSTGDTVGVFGSESLLVPTGYQSGSALSASETFDGATFTTLGLTPGTYTWSWAPPPDDSFVVNIIAPTAVPEPASLAQLGTGLLGLVGFARRRSRG